MLSAGGLYAAWEIGAWKALSKHIHPDVIVGTSAGAWNGWLIAGGCSHQDLEQAWLDPATAAIINLRRPAKLYDKARELFDRFRPRIPFALTLTEVPRLRPVLVRDGAIGWRHLAATCSIPLWFPAVEIDRHKYLDGGLLGALPLWALSELGVTRAIGLNVLTTLPFRILRRVMAPRRAAAGIRLTCLEPSSPLGSLKDAVSWSPERIRRWIDQGERDGNRAVSSITM